MHDDGPPPPPMYSRYSRKGGVVKPPDEALLLLLTAYIMIPAYAGPSGFDNNGRQANGTYIGLGDPPPSPQAALWAQ